MKAYEDLLYEQWRRQVEAVLPTLLKRNLLVKSAITAATTPANNDCGTADKTDPKDGNTIISTVADFSMIRMVNLKKLSPAMNSWAFLLVHTPARNYDVDSGGVVQFRT